MDVCHVVDTVAHSGGHSSQNSSNMDSAPGYTYIWMCAMWYTQWWAQLPELWQHGFCPRIYIYMDVCHVVYTVAHSGGHSSQNSSNMDSAPGYTVQGCVPCGIHSRTQRWVQLPELWQHGFCPRIYMDVSHVVYTVAHSGGNSCQNSGNMNSAPDIHI